MDKWKVYATLSILLVVIAIVVIIIAIYFLFDFITTTIGFDDECLKYHNKYRGYHKDTDPLTLSNKLKESAEVKAQELAKANTIDRTVRIETKRNTIESIGENIWYDMSSRSEKEFEALSCHQVVSHWYDEKKFYIYGIPWNTIPLTKHFTQIVWKSTKEVGCAKSYSTDFLYLVCHYSPKGNIFSQYNSEVMVRY